MNFYNEIILVDPIDTAALRAGKTFSATRKVCRVHQVALVFYKGDVKKIKDNYGTDEIPEVEVDERNQTNNSFTKTLQVAVDFATVPHLMRTSEEWRHGRSVKRLSKINSEVKGRESEWLKNGQECLTADRPLMGIRRKKKSGLRRSLRVFAAYNVQKKKYAAC